MRGLLITLEGVEGSGKTTVANLVAENLRPKRLDCNGDSRTRGYIGWKTNSTTAGDN